MKYIDADKLIAEIYKRREDALLVLDIDKANNLVDIIYLIESLQQEQSEVDFGMEVYKYIGEHFKVYDDGNQTLQNKDKNTLIGRVDAENIAKHFFELGLRVNNEKEK